MARAQTQLLGVKQLERKLKYLAGPVSKKAVVAGMREGLKPIAKAFRDSINAITLPQAKQRPVGQSQAAAHQHIKREARRSIGSRFSKLKSSRSSVRSAKAGFKVGQIKSVRKKRVEKGKTAKHGPKGVGASVANIHWYARGKKQTGPGAKDRVTKAGHPTGDMPIMFKGVAGMALAAAGGRSLAAQTRAVKRVIHREARKRV